MLLSADSASTVNAHSAMMLTLAIASMISPAQAQAVTCTSSSPQCCSLVRIWQLMGQTTTVSSTSATACCSMYGVACSGSVVTQINWQTLTGSIPPEIGNLTSLEWLGLSGYQLSGSIPPEIGNLVNLQELRLYYTQLSGSIPPEIGNLVNLQELYLNNNHLSGSIPPEIGNLVNLQELYLHNNQLSGSIPPEIGNLKNLQYIWLYNNQLSGSIPPEIGNLVNLYELGLYSNQLSGPIPSEIGNLTSLQSLDLFNNQLTGPIPPEIGNYLTSLQWLWLNDNQLTGPIPPEIGNLKNLQILHVHNNPGLNGTVSVNCGAKVMAANTTISTICGCAASSNIPISMPNSDTVSMACLALTYNTTLRDHYEFACPVDLKYNPQQSCMNSLGFFCGRNHINGRPNRIQGCKESVDDNFSTMSSFWIALRRECGQWAWTDGYIGNATSSSCIAAKLALQQIQNANYTEADGSIVPVSSLVIDSIQEGLWNNPYLNG